MNATLRTSLIVGASSLLALTVLLGNSDGRDDGPARKLVNSQGCKACHALEGDGGNLAISFENMQANLTHTEIRSQLVNQERKHGNGTIPDFSHLTETELEALVDFIQTISHHSEQQQ